jgi:hypothetical protein
MLAAAIYGMAMYWMVSIVSQRPQQLAQGPEEPQELQQPS